MDDVTETKAPDSQTPSAVVPRTEQWVAAVEQLFREREPGVFFVLPRVVRRVWQSELEIASPWVPPPHRKSCVIERDRLLWLVARDELGVDAETPLPQRLILIARPEEDHLQSFSREDLLRHYWQLLFHARIDFELGPKTTPARMTVAELRSRIDSLGQTQFDEVRSVLRTEQMLLHPDDPRHVYAEFVAVWHELQVFAPGLLPLYFPSLDDDEAVLRAIGPDCDAVMLLEATRPGNLAPTMAVPFTPSSGDVVEALLEGSQIHLASRSPRKYAALVHRANRLRNAGNNVRAALVRRQAFDVAPLDLMNEARQELLREIEFLVLRIQAALELTDDDVRPWLAMCERLLPAARRGFWNANARLLFDLQQVCLDHEQELYKVDLVRWMRSLGKDALKHPLPNQRVVLMSKHLRSAALRVPAVQIDSEGRKELSDLLHAAADAAEHLLRKRLEPLVASALTEAGFVPGGVVERVAFRKVTHELLDGVVQRGFLTLGDLRDAIARNQLKMPDLTDAQEFVSGDPLLRTDKLLASRVDGVYQRGPFYLRWLQRLSSLAYGTPYGRLLTKYLFLPFGLSFLTLMAVEEVAHLVIGHPPAPVIHVAVEASSSPPIAAEPAEVPPVVLEHLGEEKADQPGAAGAAMEIPPANIAPLPTAHAPPAEVGHVAVRHYRVYSHLNMFWLGCLIFALIHAPTFRHAVVSLLKATWKVLKIALVEVPRRVIKFPPVDWLLKSFPMKLFRRIVLAPVLATAVFCLVLPFFGVYERPNRWWSLAILLVSIVVLNSRIGRDTEELTREFLSRTWYRIRTHLLLGLFTLIIDAFQWLMDGLERVLYAVDEWLRFRSGESSVSLGLKAVLGLAWSVVHGVIRFCVTLLIEPQINPIKHFPVVTVSHKLVLTTLTIPLATVLERFYDRATAYTMTGLILSGIPGVFGFLAWELKENWKLYSANRSSTLRPVRIGHHGESLLRLLCPGFHSGTIPKLFARRRRAARKAHQNPNVNKQARFTEKLHHEAESLRHFVDRELVGLLRESRTFRERSLSVEHIELATNRVAVLILDEDQPDEPVRIEFAEQSSWLIADVADVGWLASLTDEDRAVFRTALAGLYKLGAVDLVREQIESQLIAPAIPVAASLPDATSSANSTATALHTHPYDIASTGLIVWPLGHYEAEVHYALDETPTTTPRPRSLARAAGLIPLPLASLLFAEHPVTWDDWRAYWETEQSFSAIPLRLLPEVELLNRSCTAGGH